ncbi:MAG: hypothetical protein ACERKD_00615 [Prolixibacteraceae bacterium]
MQTHKKGRFIFRAIVFGLGGAALITWVVMLLWNWLMPALFNLSVITYWQALGVLVLSKILFGSHGSSGHIRSYHRDKYFKDRFKEKFDFAKKYHGEHFKPAAEE